jgi:hypothetical protein
VLGALHFLEAEARKQPFRLGELVVIIGGGSAAIDCAGAENSLQINRNHAMVIRRLMKGALNAPDGKRSHPPRMSDPGTPGFPSRAHQAPRPAGRAERAPTRLTKTRSAILKTAPALHLLERAEAPEMKTKRNDTGRTSSAYRCPVAAFKRESAPKRKKKAMGVGVTP